MSLDNIKRSNNIPNLKLPRYPTIISLGSSLNIKLILSLEQKQYESLGINYNEIKKTEDLVKLYPSPLSSCSPIQLQKLASLIELHSNNFLLNSLLFINHSSPKKIPIKYIIPFSPKFPTELNFIYNIIKSITEVNHIYIEDANLLDIKPKIIFNLKLINQDVVIEEKSFIVSNENHFESKNKDNTEENKNNEINEINHIYEGDLYKSLNFSFNCDYFYSSIKELLNCKKEDCNEVISFIKKIQNRYPKMKVCINYEEDFSQKEDINFIKNLIELTDIFIFEKKSVVDFYDKIISNEDEQNENVEKNEKKESENNNSNINEDKIIEEFFIYKLRQKREKEKPLMKLGIFMNNLEEIFLIEQNPKTDTVINTLTKGIKIIPQTVKDSDINDYNEIIKSKYSSIKSVYIGSFLNHLFKQIRQESFNICLKTASKCTMRYLEILKFGLDVPSVQKYFEIKVPRPLKKKVNKEEIRNRQLESRFVLDCTNLNKNKINTYNSILDENCRNFFNSRITIKHLFKQGFINKKGMLIDPERKNQVLGFVKNANGKNNLIKKIRTLNVINFREAVNLKDNRIKKQVMINQMNNKDLYKKDFDSFQETHNSGQYFVNNKIILPKIKSKTNRNYGKHEDNKKKENLNNLCYLRKKNLESEK